MLGTIIAILIFVAGVAVATASQIVLEEPLHHLLVRILSRGLPKPSRHVRGVWECCYRYPTKGKFKYEQQLVRIGQMGPFVIAHSLKSQSHTHRLSGRLQGTTNLTGKWENTAEGENWHGAFQFVLHSNGTTMIGRWLGFDSEGTVEHGPWVWKLVSRKISKRALKEVCESWKPDSSLVSLCQPPEDLLKELVTRYGAAWENQDVQALSDIFTTNAVYQERIFNRPYMGLSRICQYWERKVVNQQANIRFRIIFLQGNTHAGVAEWEAEFDDLAKGVRKKIREVAILKIEHGKIASLREYWSSKSI